MEHSLYPVPPRFTVRRLVLMDLAAICTLYGACGRDTAWGTRETLAALFGEGEWWGGFLGGELVVCCACVPGAPGKPQQVVSWLVGSLSEKPVPKGGAPPRRPRAPLQKNKNFGKKNWENFNLHARGGGGG